MTYPLYWHRSVNFGDACSPYLCEKITGHEPETVDNYHDGEYICGVGSLLDTPPLNNAIVWGSGYAHGRYRPVKRVVCVRGANSFNVLAENGAIAENGCVIGDPALTLPMFYTPKTAEEGFIGIIPHIVDVQHVADYYETLPPHFKVLDITLPVEDFIDELNTCDFVVSSALHGLIAADAYRIPAIWAVFGDRIIGGDWKYRDYFTSVFRHEEPFYTPSIHQIEHCAANKKRYLAEILVNQKEIISCFPK